MKTLARPGELTARQREVLRAIYAHLLGHERYPTIRELKDVLGISSPNGMVGHLKYLEKKGFLRRSGEWLARGTFAVAGLKMVPTWEGGSDEVRRACEGRE